METMTILEQPASIQWDYDEEADVLYLSIGEPRSAIGVDIGEGLVVRIDETAQSVVGLTIIGLRARTIKELTAST